jgi:hypothetical protein
MDIVGVNYQEFGFSDGKVKCDYILRDLYVIEKTAR